MSFLYLLEPWEFSPTVIVLMALGAVLYLRGSLRRRPPVGRQISFWIGMVLIYIALHTRMDYYAEREFFIHRLQHLLLHHLGPFLIALAYPGPTLREGLPLSWRCRWLKPGLAWRPLRALFRVLFNPWVASFLFVGVIYIWLVPSIHFVAMLDWRLYRVMNWSVTVDGLLFWWLVLDRRPKPPARLGAGMRIMVSLLVALPQILLGAFIVFSRHDLYPIYDICGRAFPSISSAESQRIGGLILWIPSAMMSVIAALIALRNWTSLSARKRLPRQRTQQRAARQADRASDSAT
ncbi:cytochrome c oxidase assembly protein [Oleiagrimonas sp. C23AA]|uniref:cytochrome c oxidase assembly protein n=1 Tax=Oleiagrimonas sp. C23AA TaxID=2719047 RepID=UPI00142443E0|nr:cytochrome c oxidase assembly protein [Oleiagrimonas sp. C23AA]NII11679.1 cytochrome c oxidase assembly protein [Oleiagrimonas sp. C23AA]